MTDSLFFQELQKRRIRFFRRLSPSRARRRPFFVASSLQKQPPNLFSLELLERVPAALEEQKTQEKVGHKNRHERDDDGARRRLADALCAACRCEPPRAADRADAQAEDPGLDAGHAHVKGGEGASGAVQNDVGRDGVDEVGQQDGGAEACFFRWWRFFFLRGRFFGGRFLCWFGVVFSRAFFCVVAAARAF